MLGEPVPPEEIEALLACRPDLWDDPYPLYHRLRAAQPVYPTGTSVLLTRYADVAAVLRDPRMSSNRNRGSMRLADLESLAEPERTQFREMMEFTGLWMLLNDPPDHARLRGLANQAFTARRVARCASASRQWWMSCWRRWRHTARWILSPTSPLRCRSTSSLSW